MKKDNKVSIAVVKRLPKYYRYLDMIASKGIIRVSSQELSEITGLTASQIRQDLNHYGGFGQQGYGYNVEDLKGEIQKIIGINKTYNVILVGVGNIGRAIYNYAGFRDAGLDIVACFDQNPEIVGKKCGTKKILSVDKLEDYLSKNKTDIAIVAVPAKFSQDIVDRIVAGGVKGIWNFAPLDLKVPSDVILENVHLDESLFTLTYYMNNVKDYKSTK